MFLLSRATPSNSTSVRCVWQSIRQHYGLQSTGSRFLELASIKLRSDQRPKDLYRCFMAFIGLVWVAGLLHCFIILLIIYFSHYFSLFYSSSVPHITI